MIPHLIGNAFTRNEEEVGSAIRKSGVPRDEIYVTTKVRTASYIACQT